MSEIPELDAWLDRVATTVGCPREGVDVQALLDVARDVAHNQVRPGAPTSTFFVGYALGLWEAQQSAPVTSEAREAKLRELSALIQHLALASN